jgi:Fur family zinc uptake transcriptional regulator
MTTEEILKELKEAGYKFTGKRQAIVDLFVQNPNKFFTAKDVFDLIKQKYPRISFDTVYRTIALLEKHNVIEQVDANDGAAKYRLTCELHHHHHLVCLGCGQTQIIAECPMSLLHLHFDNFTPVRHRFEIYGYCASCREAS